MTIGERIKEYRKYNKLTQIQLAKKTGMGVASIQRYERNELAPNTTTLNKIAVALEISIDELLGISNIKNEMLPLVDKDSKLEEYKKHVKDNIEEMKFIQNTLLLAADEMNNIKNSIGLANIKKGDLNKFNELMNSLPSNADDLFEMGEKYIQEKNNKYKTIYQVKEKIIDIISLLGYDITTLSDDNLNKLIKNTIHSIDFEFYKLEKKENDINKEGE